MAVSNFEQLPNMFNMAFGHRKIFGFKVYKWCFFYKAQTIIFSWVHWLLQLNHIHSYSCVSSFPSRVKESVYCTEQLCETILERVCFLAFFIWGPWICTMKPSCTEPFCAIKPCFLKSLKISDDDVEPTNLNKWPTRRAKPKTVHFLILAQILCTSSPWKIAQASRKYAKKHI